MAAGPKAFSRTKPRRALVTLPLVLPPTVLGYYLLVLLGTRSPIGGFLYRTFGIRLTFTVTAAIIAATIHALPLVTKSLRAAFEGVNTDLEAAARTLGLNNRLIFFRVTLPLAAKGVLAATALAFARALGDFGVTIMIAGNIPGKTQTASVAIYDAVQAGRDNEAFTLAVTVSVIAGVDALSDQSLWECAVGTIRKHEYHVFLSLMCTSFADSTESL